MEYNKNDIERFENAKSKILDTDRQRFGIGTLSEKTLHAILKNYYEPNEDKHEIPIERYVADIFTGKEILEIQTAQFNRMREKLEIFLPLYPVTVIHPISYKKQLFWIDPESGEISDGRRYSKRSGEYLIFEELYKIKQYLKNPNLKIKIVLLDMEEYKLLNGWGEKKKNHASKFDRIPRQIEKEILIERIEDYMQCIPYELEEHFTSKSFGKAAHIPQKLATVVLNILDYMKVVERIGKEGNAYIYRVKDSYNNM